MTAKLLDASRDYRRRRGVTDWRIAAEKQETAEGEGAADQEAEKQ